MSDIAIKVENVGKMFRLGEVAGYSTIREAISSAVRTPLKWLGGGGKNGNVRDNDQILWALKDISFEVKRGEVLGVIGRNGAGKSTLLKVLSRITEPTTGGVDIFGRVGSLLEVGTGFHPELTGRENVFLNGAILGMGKAEIKAKFDEIVDFSGVEKFIDTPVKRYSSGMAVRLAFAVAAHLEPEILIVDEVLAVGDAEFQKKCLGKMNDVAGAGRTVLFVSHNMAAVEALCSRGVLLESGRLCEDGETVDVIERYQSNTLTEYQASCDLREHAGRRKGDSKLMSRATLRNEEGEACSSFSMGAKISIEVEFESSARLSPVLGAVVKTQMGVPVFGIDNRMVGGFEYEAEVGRRVIRCELDDVRLMPGGYFVDLYLGDRQRSLDCVRDAIHFDIVSADVYGTGRLPTLNCGPVYVGGRWDLEGG